jgi:CRP-like cAMP-binding protein
MGIEIEKISIFSELNSQEIDILKGLLDLREYAPNEVIYTEGEEGDSLNIIIEGKVRINKRMVEGDQFCISTLKEGDVFGIMSFLDGSRHDATIVADQKTSLLVLRRTDFDGLYSSNPIIAAKILKRLAIHLASIVRNMNTQYMDLMHLMFRRSK